MEFSQPPPDPMAGPNFANPPPTTRILSYQGPQQQQKQHGFYHHRPYHHFNGFRGGPPMTQDDFDGKRLRKSVMRKTVDYNASIIKALEVGMGRGGKKGQEEEGDLQGGTLVF